MPAPVPHRLASVMPHWFRSALLGLLLLAGPHAPAGATNDFDLAAEVPPPARLRSGRLPNGVRFAILPHQGRAGAASLRLLVEVGSLHERDDERGYAHFVEHLAFAGTRRFPAGELVERLQLEGVKFGPHLNAETAYDRTLYRLDLATVSPARLETALALFRDFADGLPFDTAAVQRERAVILAEDFVRRTPLAAQRSAQTELLFAGTRLPARPPIGTEPTIRAATAPRLREFHEAWYRPENLTVIVVGDLDPAATAVRVSEHFASLVARAPVRTAPATGSPHRPTAPAVALHPNPSLGALRIQLGAILPEPVGPARWSDLVRETSLHAAIQMLARRLDRLERRAAAPFANASAATGTPCRGFRALNFAFTAGPAGWATGLAALEQEIRRVETHGFTAEEVALHGRLAHDDLAHAVETEGTGDPAGIADALATALGRGTPFFAATEQRASRTQLLDSLTPESCTAAFREAHAHSPLSVFVSGPAPLLPSRANLIRTLRNSRRIAVAAPVPGPVVEFAYDDFGPPGAIVCREYVPDLDLWLVEFANGVRLSLKRTSFEPGLVRGRVRLGHGRAEEPPEHPGLSMWTSAWFAGGLGRHDWAAVTALADHHHLALTCTRETDAFLLGGSARPAQLDLLLRILTAYVADPAFRPEGFAATTAAVDRTARPRYAEPDGAVQVHILPRLAGGDPRIGTPPAEVLFANQPEHLRAWLAPIVAQARPEIALVGDLDPERAIAAAARAFGALPPRDPPPFDPARRTLHFLAPPVTETCTVNAAAPRPARLELFWRTGDTLSVRQRWHLALLAAVLEERIRTRVRTQDGATYAPRATFSRTAAYTGFATLRCSLDVAPEQAAHYLDAVRDLAADLARTGIRSEELARAQAPLLANARAGRIDNGYWLDEVLAEAQSDPERLPAARSLEHDIASATPEDLATLAARYLRPEQSFRFIIRTVVASSPAPGR